MKPNNKNIADNTIRLLRNEVPAQQIPAVNAEAIIRNSGERERSCCCRFCDFTFQTFAAGFNLQALFAEFFRADEKYHCHLSCRSIHFTARGKLTNKGLLRIHLKKLYGL